MIQIIKTKASSQYREFGWAVKNNGQTIFTSDDRIEAECVAAWVKAQEISA